jgi:hypothetical protein
MDRIRQIGLDASEARKAAYLLARRGWDIPDDIITLDGLVAYLALALGKAGRGAC